jgi:hypothetical protein
LSGLSTRACLKRCSNIHSTGIWKIIKGWLDPVVAAKVNFTNSVEDLEQFIPRDRLLKELGGDEDYEYEYIEPEPNENDTMKDTAKRDEVLAKFKTLHKELQDATKAWVVAASKGDQETVDSSKAKREELIEKTGKTYWEADPYVRARSFYDRIGVLKGNGKVDFYPEKGKGKAKASEGAQVAEKEQERVESNEEKKSAEAVTAEAENNAVPVN